MSPWTTLPWTRGEVLDAVILGLLIIWVLLDRFEIYFCDHDDEGED